MVGVAVLGVGGWGINHVRVLRDLSGEGLVDTLVAVDINVERLRYVAKRFKCEHSTSIDEVLKREDVEAVIVSTPTPLHFDHALKAITAGKHVLVEKPMTSTVREALALVEKAREQGVVLMVGFIMRYGTGLNYLKDELLAKGVLGRVLTVTAKRTSYWPRRPMDVGVIRDLAIHDIDVVYFLTGERALWVHAITGTLKHDYEDYAVLMIGYNSFVSVIEANWVTPYKIRLLNVTGESASVKLDYLTQEVVVMKEDGVYVPRVPYEEPLMREDRDFLLSIVEKRRPLAPGEEGVAALAVCEAALKSAEKGCIVEVEYPV